MARRPPLVPGVQATKSLRKLRSLESQLNGRLLSRAWEMVGGRSRAKPLLRSCECMPNTWWQEGETVSTNANVHDKCKFMYNT